MENTDLDKDPQSHGPDDDEEADASTTRPQKGEWAAEHAIDEAEDGPEGSPSDESTVPDLSGNDFDPIQYFAVLALVDIAPPVKRKRKIPQLHHLTRAVTVIGSGRTAHIKVDDLSTVEPEHAAIVFREGKFHVYPQNGTVRADGKRVFKRGALLKHGSRIELGSGRFLFLVNQ